MSKTCEGCIACKRTHALVRSGDGCADCVCGTKHTTINDEVLESMITKAHGLTFQQWLHKEAGHSVPQPAIKKASKKRTQRRAGSSKPRK